MPHIDKSNGVFEANAENCDNGVGVVGDGLRQLLGWSIQKNVTLVLVL